MNTSMSQAMIREAMATTYVRITRSEIEDWLRTLRVPWELKDDTQGVFLVSIPGSDHVKVRFTSSIARDDRAMGKGQAAMTMSLYSPTENRVLNRKATGQGKFYRTTNWRQRLTKAYSDLKQAYLNSREFYEKIADFSNYREAWENRIRLIEDHESDSFLRACMTKLHNGKILLQREEEKILQLLEKTQQKSVREVTPSVDEGYLDRIRRLYVEARRQGDTWTKDFAHNVGNQYKQKGVISPKQQEKLEEKFQYYRIVS